LPNKNLDIIWLRASILGGIWASSEIIIGSFLHNLRIPLAGMLLSAISVFILTAFDKQWKINGVIWRAGIIAALMKSISPSAVIFGPMIGIFCEALIFHIVVVVFGRNIFGYSLGGALAVAWSFIQMIAGILIVYGSNIVLLYSNVIKSVFNMLYIKNADPSLLIIVLLVLHLLFGIIAAVFGYFVKKNTANETMDFTKQGHHNTEGSESSFKKHSLVYLSVVIVAMVLGLGYVGGKNYIFSSLYLLLFVIASVMRYGSLLKRVVNTKFWIEIAFIALFSSFFLSKLGGQPFFSLNGFNAGYQMIFRAVLLSFSFNIMSIELSNPKIKSLFNNKRLRNASGALETSFNTLPILISVLAVNKKKVNKPLVLVSEFIDSADKWIEYKLNNSETESD
jgi:hypothetical protein